MKSSLEISVVRPGQVAQRYRMYEGRDLSPDGAVLTGSLLLELNEEVTLELLLPGGPILVRARVTAVDGERGAVRVAFVGVDEATRRVLVTRNA